jgi:ABC-type bacteriocin/lantibiotic exporter with double-glycine peptidase domain
MDRANTIFLILLLIAVIGLVIFFTSSWLVGIIILIVAVIGDVAIYLPASKKNSAKQKT